MLNRNQPTTEKENTISDHGDVASKRPTRNNKRVDRPARRQAQRAAYMTPMAVKWCLGNSKQASIRFTPWQWAVLITAWGGWSGHRTSEQVARMFDVAPRDVREARAAAEATARELFYAWRPALERWKNGETLPEDRKILDRHRRAKLGRLHDFTAPRTLAEVERAVPVEDMGTYSTHDALWTTD